MRTLVTFRTDRFNVTEERGYFSNPNCFGDDCARWVAAALRAGGAGDVGADAGVTASAPNEAGPSRRRPCSD